MAVSVGICGTFFISLSILAFRDVIVFNDHDGEAYYMIHRYYLHETLRQHAANVIKTAFQIRKTLEARPGKFLRAFILNEYDQQYIMFIEALR
jgi:hypothetical protein